MEAAIKLMLAEGKKRGLAPLDSPDFFTFTPKNE
jgi:hypothetical protein